MILKPLQLFTYNKKYQDKHQSDHLSKELFILIFNINVFITVSNFISMLNIKPHVGSKLIKPVCKKLSCHILIWGRNRMKGIVLCIYFLSNKDAKCLLKNTLTEHEVLSI